MITEESLRRRDEALASALGRVQEAQIILYLDDQEDPSVDDFADNLKAELKMIAILRAYLQSNVSQ